MIQIHFSRILPVAVLLLIVLAGCGGKQDTSTSGPTGGPAAAPDQAVQNHLNDPHVSEAEKAQIRSHMPSSGK